MDKAETLEMFRYKTRISNELKNKKKSKVYQLDYKMFSNVIQKARQTVELHKMCSKQITKVIEEDPPFNRFEDKYNNIGTSPVKTNYNYTLKFNRITLLSDVKFVIGFLDYGNRIVKDAFSLSSKILHEIGVFKNFAKYIDAALHNVRQSEFLAKLDGKVNDDDIKTVICLNEEVLVTGVFLQVNIQEALKNLNCVMERSFMNFKIISNAVSMFCSLSVETEIDHNRDLLYAIIKQVDHQINIAHEAEIEINRSYCYLPSKLLEMHHKSTEFFNLYCRLIRITLQYGL